MRPLLLFLLMSVACPFATLAEAQSCVPATDAGIFLSAATCVHDVSIDKVRCEPGDTLTFTATFFNVFVPATCPAQVTWDFRDGSPSVTTMNHTIQHAFPAGNFDVLLLAQLQNRSQSYAFPLLIGSGYLNLTTTTPTIGEGQSTTVIVQRRGDLSRVASVDYVTNGAFIPTTGTLNFAIGESRKDVELPTFDDLFWNGGPTRSGQFLLHNPGGGLAFRQYGDDVLTFVIHDNDLPAVHNCTQTSLAVNESAGQVTFGLERSGNLAAGTTGYIETTGWPSGAISGGRYTVSFLPGETTHDLTVPVRNDTTYSGIRKSNIVCGGAGPGASAATFSGEVSVYDDEPLPTVVAADAITLTETDAPQRVSIPVSFIPPFTDPYVRVVLAHGTTDDEDVRLITHSATSSIELEITGDDRPEADESFTVMISDVVSKAISVTIRDDDRPAFPYSFDRETYTVDEEQGDAVVVIRRTGDLSSAIELGLKVRDVTKGTGELIPVSLGAGEASKEVSIQVDDALYTGNRSNALDLELNGFVGATAQLIVNEDEPMPSLSVGDVSAREGDPGQRTRLEIPVRLSAPIGFTIKVTLSATNMTTNARDLVDIAPRTVTITAGDIEARAVYEVIGDADIEPDETFTITVTSCCDGWASVARRTATATLLDDDRPPSTRRRGVRH